MDLPIPTTEHLASFIQSVIRPRRGVCSMANAGLPLGADQMAARKLAEECGSPFSSPPFFANLRDAASAASICRRRTRLASVLTEDWAWRL